ncbi:response regulator transcription factor [Neorhizobium alkalisoli]|jgi:CheY-like chemotaxis protein|uniref:Response regulator receiver domain-containing protein n=1 Tax=Neorhizobium alkalisoli TaxID=528178 RepID=A0A561R2K4_9HYPH|nr:response regulator [Neorhizobium alkalisoli]TWF56839.1 response regulator receiver domain-containing protein [Neorhizobium alkalisoli]
MGSSKTPTKPAVLVVEDEPLLLMMALDLVEDAGFEPVEARNADEALEILQTRKDIRIVFTDIDMPGTMNGMRLAAMVRDRWPPIEIIIVSGHVKGGDVTLPPRSVFYSKPYDTSQITAQLHRMAALH